MRHKVFGNQLGRNTKQARALYRGLVRDVLSRGRIETTLAKARAIVPMIDRVVTLAKKNTVAARREIIKILGSDQFVTPAFPNRNSGYTRIIRLGERFSDQAKLVILELVEKIEPAKKVEEPKVVKKVVSEKKQNDN